MSLTHIKTLRWKGTLDWKYLICSSVAIQWTRISFALSRVVSTSPAIALPNEDCVTAITPAHSCVKDECHGQQPSGNHSNQQWPKRSSNKKLDVFNDRPPTKKSKHVGKNKRRRWFIRKRTSRVQCTTQLLQHWLIGPIRFLFPPSKVTTAKRVVQSDRRSHPIVSRSKTIRSHRSYPSSNTWTDTPISVFRMVAVRLSRGKTNFSSTQALQISLNGWWAETHGHRKSATSTSSSISHRKFQRHSQS